MSHTLVGLCCLESVGRYKGTQVGNKGTMSGGENKERKRDLWP